MARRIGEALIGITPDTLGFPATLRAKLKAALTGIKADVPINGDTARLDAAIAAAKAKIATLKHQLTGMNLDLATKEFTAKIAAARAEVRKLESETSRTKLDMDSTAAIAKIAALKAQQVHLANAMGKMTADVDIRAASTKILALGAEVVHLDSVAKELELSANSGKVDAALTAARAKVAVLQSAMKNMPVSANLEKFRAQLAVARVELEELTRKRTAEIGVDVDVGLLKRASAALADLFSKNNNPKQSVFGWGIFGRAVAGVSGNISILHVALDAALEAIISIGLAAAAGAIGVAAMAPAAENVALQLRAIDTVNESLGNQIPGLSRKFDALAQSLAPQVITAFGGALTLLNQNSGVFEKTARDVTSLINDWVARLDIWAKSQNQLGGILQTGVGFLSQFGNILGHIGEAILGLIKADPGTAQFLLGIVDGFAKVLDWVSKLPGPLLQVALLMASIHTWANVLGGVLSKMPGILGNVGAALVRLLAGPAGLVIIALVALSVELARAWGTSSVAVATAVKRINDALDSMSTAEAFFALPAAIGALNDQLKQVNSGGLAAIERNWTGMNDIWQRSADKIKVLGSDLKGIFTGSTVSELRNFGAFFKDLFTSNAGDKEALLQQKQDVANLNNEINKLLGSSRNLDNETGVLIRQGFSFSQSLALMSLAGVKVNDSFEIMHQKVENLISGYQAISVRGAILTNSVDAITFAAGLQETKVNDLNSSWDTFISTVTGSESGFATVETSIGGMFAAAAQGGAHLTDSNGRVSSSFGTIAGSAGKAAASFTGLDTTSLALQQTFNQSVTSANSMLDALTSQAAAANLGKQGTDLLAQATKDLVIQLLPAAKGSSTLTAELYALAQRGGYTGANSFKALSAWVEKTRNPMQGLQGIVETFTVKSAGLTEDVKNLSVALGTTLNTAMSDAVFLASGGQKAFTTFASAVLTSHGNMDKLKPSAAALISQLIKMTGNTTDAKKEFLSFAQGALKLTTAQANALWKSVAAGDPVQRKSAAQAAAATAKFKIMAAQMGATANESKASVSVYRKAWNDIYGATVGAATRIGHNVATQFNSLRHSSANIFNGIRHDTASTWDNIYRDVVNKITQTGRDGVTRLKNNFVNPLHNTFDKLRSWIWTDFIVKISNFFTQTLPHSFSVSVSAIGRVWSGIKNAITGPLHRVASPIANLFRAIDSVTSFVHLGTPLAGAVKFLGGLHTGGQVPGGFGGGDRVHALLEPGEAVVDKVTTRKYSKVLGQMGVPGFASGGLVSEQAAERGAYARLVGSARAALAHPDAWLRSNQKSVTNELGTLARRQQAEQAAYATLAGRGLTKGNLSKFATKAREEITVTKDKRLSQAEPALTKSLAAALKNLVSGAATAVRPPSPRPPVKPPPVRPPGPPPSVKPPAGKLASGLTRAQYQADLREVHGLPISEIRENPHLRHVWHLLHLQHLADIQKFAGGGQIGYPDTQAVRGKFKPVNRRRPDEVPGFATGGQIEQSMLNFMTSKIGSPYSEANRWGRPPWDCSSLLWDAAHHAGVPIPQSQSTTGVEANWFGNAGNGLNPFVYREPGKVQTGDLLFTRGAAPLGSNYGGTGHVGMAIDRGTMVSALGTQWGVTKSAISDLVVGIGLGGPGGKNVISLVAGGIGGIIRSIEDIFSGVGKFAKVAIDLAHGDTGGAGRALTSLVPPSAGGAKGLYGETLLDIPKVLTGDVMKFLENPVKAFGASQQAASGAGPAGGVTGSALANGKMIYNYLLKNLFGGNKIAAAGATASIYGESGWNPFAVNCVPLSYKIVTTRGVLSHDELRTGDQTPAFNPATGQPELATVLDIPYHDGARTCRIGNGHWSVTCTWDHKWITGDGLVRADELPAGAKILLGDGWWEPAEFIEDAGTMDTWCVTTTTGTWTTVDEAGTALWTGNSNGRGLIGWTPQSTISNADFSGGMRTQLPAILRFVVNSGDSAVIAEMFRASSVLQAANEWGVGVERFGINDVHPAGVALASSFMSKGGRVFDQGGTLAPGANLVFNRTGRPEHLTPDGGGSGTAEVHLHVHGPVGSQQELQRWLLESVRELSRVKGGGSAERAFSRR